MSVATNEEVVYENVGTIQASRIYGGGGDRLVGSTVPCDTRIRLRIAEGSVHCDEFNKEVFRSKAGIVEVEMTQMQWAELITSLNMGDGQPCTITTRNRSRVKQEYVSQSVADYYDGRLQRNFKKVTADYRELFEDAKDILENKKTITKADREKIIGAYSRVERFMGDSAPFMEKLFKEDLDKHSTAAAIQFKVDMERIVSTLSEERLKELLNIGDSGYNGYILKEKIG